MLETVTRSDAMEMRRLRLRRWRRVAILGLWVVMAAWLVRFEAYPELFTRRFVGYRGLISRDLLVMDSWMRITFKGSPIGYSHTAMEVNEANPMDYHQIQNRVHVKFKAMGELQNLRVDTMASLNALYELQSFFFSMSTDTYKMDLKANRMGARQFRVFINAGRSRQLTMVDIPPDVVLYSPMTEMALKNLKPGQEMALRTFDPATLNTAMVTLRALRRETITVGGQSHEVTTIASDYQGASMKSYINANGEVLRQETSIGWTMEKCTVDEAFEALRAADKAEDMLSGLAVPCKGRLPDVAGPGGIRLKLKGVAFFPGELESNRQRMESLSERETILALRPASIPGEEVRGREEWLRVGGGAPPKEFKPWLAHSIAVQSDHPEIQKKAREIVGDSTEPMEKARKIFDWVHRRVEKVMTISLPSALDVLRTMKGDCNEHTYLFVALARAAGLPAQIKVGLAYHKGAFYYHAWPAVYVGDWVEMDPTWGQVTADAAHIALVEGELASQIQMVKVIGQLKIEVLEGAKPPPAAEPAGKDKGEGP